MMSSSRVHGICDSCAKKINWISDNPFRAVMDMYSFDDLMACCRYGYLPRRMVYNMKLHGGAYIARGLGRLMGERLLRSGAAGVLTEVPIHRRKLALRGYNQAALLARAAAEESGLEYVPGLLIKTRETKESKRADAHERTILLSGSIEADNNRLELITGNDIILIDDVVTSGSTADACAMALKNAGARSVKVLCFASASHMSSDEEEEEY